MYLLFLLYVIVLGVKNNNEHLFKCLVLFLYFLFTRPDVQVYRKSRDCLFPKTGQKRVG